MTSLEAADKWRAKNNQRGIGSKTKARNNLPVGRVDPVKVTPESVEKTAKHKHEKSAMAGGLERESPAGSSPSPTGQGVDESALPEEYQHRAKPDRLENMEQTLRAMISVQTEAYAQVNRSQDRTLQEEGMLSTRIAAFVKASEGRMKVEEAIQAYEIQAERLITFEKCTALISRAMGPLISRLWNLSKICAAKANPSDPVLAEEVISQAVREVVKEARTQAFPEPGRTGEEPPSAEKATPPTAPSKRRCKKKETERA